jgi:molybdenum cofactor cytidylyltransferase
MIFRRVSLERAEGHILGHNVSHAGRRTLKKGRRLGQAELAEIAGTGISSVYVAELEPTDVPEDTAAKRIGEALAERAGLLPRAAHGGRVSLLAGARGVVSVQSELLLSLNLLSGVTLATVPSHSVCLARQTLATLKVIPFALPEATVARAEQLAAGGVLSFRALTPRRVCVLVSGSEGRRERLLAAYRPPLEQRLAGLGTHAVSFEYLALTAEPEASLAAAIVQQLDSGVQLLIIVGETATMDVDDVAPQAIRRAAGEVLVVGAPVFPGNLLLLGYRGGAAILGAPGCVRSRARNVVDLLLPRLLVGERLGQREVAELGHGGLLGAASEGSNDEADPNDTGEDA